MGWILAVIMTIVAIVALTNRPSKRFGLKEAQAALQYVRSGDGGPQVAKAVLAVVVGVLGYNNAVSEDVAIETERVGEESSERSAQITENEQTIESLRAEIERLRVQNETSSAYAEELRAIAAIFRG